MIVGLLWNTIYSIWSYSYWILCICNWCACKWESWVCWWT